jgi:general secretion pathway protein K
VKSRVFFLNGKSQRGYILALNIAVLAVMLVGATYMGQRMSLAINLARAEHIRVSGELAMESARAQILYLLATVPRSNYGLGTLPDRAVALDGREYRIGKDIRVSFQDARGLISVNGIGLDGRGRERIERLLGTYNLDVTTISQFTDNLLDYRDIDDLRRINGAEKEDYVLAGKGGEIRNSDLLAPTEVVRVLGWAGSQSLWDGDSISYYLNTLSTSLFNPNTADWRALVAITGTTEQIAKSLVKTRRTGETPDISRMIFTDAINDPFGLGATISLYPSETIIVTLHYADSPSSVRMAVKHTPSSEVSPWLIQYTYKVPLPKREIPVDKLPELPAATALRDFKATYQVQLPF